MKQKNKGITLIALIVTIIILIILAGVSISALLGNNGILKMAQQSKDKYNNSVEEEKRNLDDLYSSMLVATNDDSQITISIKDLRTLIRQEVQSAAWGETINPTGTIISYMGNNAPTGYLFCDGTEYNIADYKNLAEQIKKEFGSYNYYGGDGTTTFKVPNLQGEFLRGYSTNSASSVTNGVSTVEVGKHQEATLHKSIWVDGYLGSHANGGEEYLDTAKYTNSTWTYASSGQNITNSRSHYTSRPTNTSVLYCIKY